MIDVYGMSSPNVSKVIIMLEEVGLPYRARHVNVAAGEQYAPTFLRISPNNKVPVIVDEQGPGGGPFNVFESGAILLYLANKTGRLLPTEPAARSIVEQWLMVQIASVGPMFGQCSHFQRFAPPGNDYGRERYTSEVRRLFKVLEQRLAASAFLGGAEYSIADVATFPWIRTALAYFPWLAATPDEALSHYPSLQRWFAAIAARPAVQRGLEAEKRFLPLDIDAFGKADAEAIDRFCGRGRFAQA
ncbi:MAG TPA: glutathione S-transferase N-terminal domain-containing protein [Steroidobacteraceae bacterium]|mgnify:FL=1|nr:glutathione S-transferase N-terminal domain-containing protein [Steroidobacteraceae bacterium]HQW08682.1 glutathione S-transferase N-terminal domain-containing protein [Steroidobacteraceae bacterium]HQX46209.1 glutathione S-transferase N-terminal domain-containing protein [Steroidobacteraceae bacterium]HQX77523.1 glutathione S-transferase N-terminal domain-containing protein [Steroidobacteraceae bacterium]HQZ81312.1 glutathione S-transferase N-terminal domain-containing protein [Steroidobact